MKGKYSNLVKKTIDTETKLSLLKGFMLFFLLSVSVVLLSFFVVIIFSNTTLSSQVSNITSVWNLLLGLPVTAAGAVIAILLAQKSIDISHSQKNLEQKSLELNQKVAEFEFKTAVGANWEEAVCIYARLSESVERLSKSLSALQNWHLKPKNHLSFYGAELSTVAKGPIQSSIERHLETSVSPFVLKDELVSAFNCYECDSLQASQSSLMFSDEKNKELAFESYKQFHDLAKNGVTQALEDIEKSLREINSHNFTYELWKLKYNQHLTSKSFMLDNACQHLENIGVKFIKPYDKNKFDASVYSTPVSLQNELYSIRQSFLSQDSLKSLFLLTSNYSSQNGDRPNLLTLLSIMPVLKGEDTNRVGNIMLHPLKDHYSYPDLPWDEMEPESIMVAHNWASHSLLLFKDLVRMMPDQKDVVSWAKSNLDISLPTVTWLENILCYDTKVLFENNIFLQPICMEKLLGLIDTSDEDHRIELFHSTDGLRAEFGYSSEFDAFLCKVFSAIAHGHISYQTDERKRNLFKSSHQAHWKTREAKSCVEEMIISHLKQNEEMFESIYVDGEEYDEPFDIKEVFTEEELKEFESVILKDIVEKYESN
ncbi:hypothetical protein [Vibrio furnissii]|uniref:hypothetical protein n=1 Tax=Vibrio furnissii TaxID=29494 RepID=UPI0023D98618|nr:hypothetical protein [Vibrio furnissii]